MLDHPTTFEQLQPVGHGGAFLAIVLAWAGYLTPLVTIFATLVSAVWFCICVWESETCKYWRMGLRHWKNNWVMRRRARILAALKARELKVQAQITAMETLRTARIDARDTLASAAAEAARLVAHQPVETAVKTMEQTKG